jgi:fructose-bisphosphate aldolase class 1
LKNQALITFVVIPINVGVKGNTKIISNRLTLFVHFRKMKKVIQASSSKPSNEVINSSVKQPWET